MFRFSYLSVSLTLLIGLITLLAQNVSTSAEEIFNNESIDLQYISSIEKTTLGQWMQGTSMPHPRYYGGSVMYTRNDTSWLYVFGGDTTGSGVATATCLRYNLNTDAWEYIASMPEPLRTNAAARLGDKLYTMGGFNAPFPSPAVASFYEYDINTDTWSQLPDLPDPLFFAGAEGFEDSLIYIIGGIQDNVVTDDLWRHHVVLYNANFSSFRDADPMPEATASFGHSLVGSSLFVQAGLKSTTELWNLTLQGNIDLTNRARITWTSRTSYPLSVYAQYSYAVSDDEIYSGGGSTTTGFAPVSNAYGFTISTNTYEIEPDLPYNSMAVFGGVNYMSAKNSGLQIIKVAIAGGITTGPQLTNQCWVYTDTLSVQGISSENGTIPTNYSLIQNYPNPFNPSTTIRFSIIEEKYVSLTVYNSLGEEIETLVADELSAGIYNYNWTASSLTSGVYFYKLQAGSFIETKKMVLLK